MTGAGTASSSQAPIVSRSLRKPPVIAAAAAAGAAASAPALKLPLPLPLPVNPLLVPRAAASYWRRRLPVRPGRTRSSAMTRSERRCRSTQKASSRSASSCCSRSAKAAASARTPPLPCDVSSGWPQTSRPISARKASPISSSPSRTVCERAPLRGPSASSPRTCSRSASLVRRRRCTSAVRACCPASSRWHSVSSLGRLPRRASAVST
mmetsp:Transcript_109808/g.354525  ORF Transcript_109808/g.354525 Transcript_109808/m.354525 type:complete len:209 (-) Transcript_109808:271-897(-)